MESEIVGLGTLACLGVLLAALSVLLATFRTGVPPVPSTPAEVRGVLQLLRDANLPANAIVYELGCGWGGLALAIADAFPDAHVRGIELSRLPYWVSRWRGHPRIQVQRANFYRQDLSDADAVVCYLMRKPMPKLAKQFDAQLKPNTPVVSVAFWFHDREPNAEICHGHVAVARYDWPGKARPQKA